MLGATYSKSTKLETTVLCIGVTAKVHRLNGSHYKISSIYICHQWQLLFVKKRECSRTSNCLYEHLTTLGVGHVHIDFLNKCDFKKLGVYLVLKLVINLLVQHFSTTNPFKPSNCGLEVKIHINSLTSTKRFLTA